MMFGRVRGRDRILLYALALAGCTAAHASGEPAAADVYAMSAGRSLAVVAMVLASTAAILGGLSLARSAGPTRAGNRRRRAVLAMVAGLFGAVLGGLVVAASAGGIGSGNGVGGAIVAIVLGAIGMALGGLALTRPRDANP